VAILINWAFDLHCSFCSLEWPRRELEGTKAAMKIKRPIDKNRHGVITPRLQDYTTEYRLAILINWAFDLHCSFCSLEWPRRELNN
jgi:hypothetical protein